MAPGRLDAGHGPGNRHHRRRAQYSRRCGPDSHASSGTQLTCPSVARLARLARPGRQVLRARAQDRQRPRQACRSTWTDDRSLRRTQVCRFRRPRLHSLRSFRRCLCRRPALPVNRLSAEPRFKSGTPERVSKARDILEAAAVSRQPRFCSRTPARSAARLVKGCAIASVAAASPITYNINSRCSTARAAPDVSRLADRQPRRTKGDRLGRRIWRRLL